MDNNSTDFNSIIFLEQYCIFEPAWVWVMTGIARNKDNKDGKDSFLRRMVIAKKSDILDCYTEIHNLANVPGVTYRIYISLNARDANKAFFNFQKKLLEINLGLFQGHNDAQAQVTKIGSIWKTELQQTQNRATKYFLIDVDNDPNGLLTWDILRFIEENGINVVSTVKTVTGQHIVIKACDTRPIVDFCKKAGFAIDIQKDSMVFVEQFKA